MKLITILLTIVASTVLLAQRHKDRATRNSNGDSKPEVFVKVIRSTEIFEPKIFGGFIQSSMSRPTSPEVAGILDKFLVLPGQRVRKNQELFLIKPRGSDANFQYHRVLSPFNGVVSLQLKEVGAFLQQGDEVLVISDPTKLFIKFDAALQDAINLKPRMEGDVLVSEPGAEAQPIKGTITAVSPASHPTLRTYQVYMRLQCQLGCPAVYRIGAFARVTIKENMRQGFKIPVSYLKNNGSSIFIVEGNKLKEIKVDSGQSDGQTVEVFTGLEDGMKVVTNHSGRLRDGREIVVKQRAAEKNAVLPKDLRLNESTVNNPLRP